MRACPMSARVPALNDPAARHPDTKLAVVQFANDVRVERELTALGAATAATAATAAGAATTGWAAAAGAAGASSPSSDCSHAQAGGLMSAAHRSTVSTCITSALLMQTSGHVTWWPTDL